MDFIFKSANDGVVGRECWKVLTHEGKLKKKREGLGKKMTMCSLKYALFVVLDRKRMKTGTGEKKNYLSRAPNIVGGPTKKGIEGRIPSWGLRSSTAKNGKFPYHPIVGKEDPS